MRGPSAYVRLQLGFWALVLALRLAPIVIEPRLMLEQLPFAASWALGGLAGSHAAYRGLLAAPMSSRPWAIARWLVALGVIASAMVVAGWLSGAFSDPPREAQTWGGVEAHLWYAMIRSTSAIPVAGAWCAGAYSLMTLGEARRVELARMAAELDAAQSERRAEQQRLASLRARVQPHFLFNALNTVRALIPEDPDAARQAVSDLSVVLRQGLATGELAEYDIETERAMVEAYLRIESLRFGDRLVWLWAQEGEDGFRLPPMLAQGLIENAIKHGLAKSTGPFAIHVSACRTGHMHTLTVRNTGRVVADAGEGRGLAIARETLRLQYGETSQLLLEEGAGIVSARAIWSARSETPT